MKGRSHRLPTSAPPDDWVDESWTVDCVCGVNFDDGEEMVNCDECGVWVHTRCSRYVKGEASFACDKCKSKNSRNDNEETEVAQLLVELPTKTMNMEKSSPLNQPARRPFRLWSEMPMEEKVHVQGIPGGEPALFGGLSSVFSRELWNCTGYVPKKFNFQYKEFPCWKEKQEADDSLGEENDNPVNKGADVLFSLSKDTVLRMSGTRDQAGESGSDGKSSLKPRKKVEGKDLQNRHLLNGETKERRLLKPIIIHSSKRKKEDLGTSIDQNGKKKAKAVDREYDSKKKGAHQMTVKTVFTPTNDPKQLEFYEARAPKYYKTETQNIKSGNLKDMAQELVSDGILTAGDNVVKPVDSLAAKESSPEGLSSDTYGHKILTGIGVKECKAGDQVLSSTESSLKIMDGVPLHLENNDVGRPLLNEEGVSVGIHDSNRNGRHSPSVQTDLQKSEQSDEGLTNATSEFKGNHILHDSNSDMSLSFAQPITKVKTENDFCNTREVLPSSPFDGVIVTLDGFNTITPDPGISGHHTSENNEMLNAVASSRQSHDLKVHDVDRCPAAVSDQHIGKADELSGSPRLLKQELQSTESSIPVQKEPAEPKYGSKLTEEPLKSSETILSPSITSSQRKVLSSVGKSCFPSSTVLISKSSISDSLKYADSHNLNSVTKNSAMNSCTISMKKEHAANDVVRDEVRQEIMRRAVKERPKSSVDPTSKASNHNKISHASVSKQSMADSKDSIVSSKTSAANVNANLVVGQPIGSEQTQRGFPVENKVLACGLPHRGENYGQPGCLLSSKLNHAVAALPTAPSKGPAGLSDEELALLLHQELNSSPRVPRVPRMRQTGSLPQSASSAATTCMQFKRSSGLAGKDNIMVSRRRTKDVCRDGARSCRDLDDAKKLDRKSSSPDQQKSDLLCTLDASSNRNMFDDSSNLVHSVTKNISLSTMAASGGVSSSMDAHNPSLSYIRNSPRNISDDDTGSTDAFSHQTLPGLLSEIMSKGKRMTYEELCNEVLPHWPNLRKHNGERYAYSSHSQAVLDCLRNRTEWAQLVDRGPKTNTNKKRRKVDAELEDECGKSVCAEAEGKSLESREFPKGKRKARKRRRLILQGRDTKDVRKTRKACLLTDDDYALSSNSSEESMFSEDETQDGGTCRAESEASASSDEPGTTS